MNHIETLSKETLAKLLTKSFGYNLDAMIELVEGDYFEFKYSPQLLELRIPNDLNNEQVYNVICFSLIKQRLSPYLDEGTDEEIYEALYPIVKAFNRQFQTMLYFSGGFCGEENGDRTRFN